MQPTISFSPTSFMPTRSPTAAPTQEMVVLKGFISLANLNLTSFSPIQLNEMKESIRLTISNLTNIPLSYIQDVQFAQESISTGGRRMRRLVSESANTLVTYLVEGRSAEIEQSLSTQQQPQEGESLEAQISNIIGEDDGSNFLQQWQDIVELSQDEELVEVVRPVTFVAVATIDITPTRQPSPAPTTAAVISDGNNAKDDILHDKVLFPVILVAGGIFFFILFYLSYYVYNSNVGNKKPQDIEMIIFL